MKTLASILLVGGLIAAESDYQSPDDKAMLGVTMTPTSSQAQTKNGIDADIGVEVTNIYGGTAAEKMGLQTGDVITSINGSTVGSMTDLRNEVALTGVGGPVHVVVLRDGVSITSNGTLGDWPKEIPYEQIDATAERRFRDWQSRRMERSQQAVMALAKQVEALERESNKSATRQDQSTLGSLTPLQAAALPVTAALNGLPAWKLSLRTSYDTVPPAEVTAPATIAWDARVLLGTPAPGIL